MALEINCVTTTSTTTTTTVNPLCPPVDPCEGQYEKSHCITYVGIDYHCAGIKNGDDVNEVIIKLLEGIQQCCDPVPTTTTSTSTTTTSTTSTTSTSSTTTTTTACPNDIYLICCGSNVNDTIPIIVRTCTIEFITATPGDIFIDFTNGSGPNAFVWVAATLAEIISLGYTGTTSNYVPDYLNFGYLATGTGGTNLQKVVDALNKCLAYPSSCPVSNITTTSTTTTTTTNSQIPECLCYSITNNTASNITYSYRECELGNNIIDVIVKNSVKYQCARTGSITGAFPPPVQIGLCANGCAAPTTTTSTTSTTSTTTTTTSTTVEPEPTTTTTSTSTTTTAIVYNTLSMCFGGSCEEVCACDVETTYATTCSLPPVEGCRIYSITGAPAPSNPYAPVPNGYYSYVDNSDPLNPVTHCYEVVNNIIINDTICGVVVNGELRTQVIDPPGYTSSINSVSNNGWYTGNVATSTTATGVIQDGRTRYQMAVNYTVATGCYGLVFVTRNNQIVYQSISTLEGTGTVFTPVFNFNVTDTINVVLVMEVKPVEPEIPTTTTSTTSTTTSTSTTSTTTSTSTTTTTTAAPTTTTSTSTTSTSTTTTAAPTTTTTSTSTTTSTTSTTTSTSTTTTTTIAVIAGRCTDCGLDFGLGTIDSGSVGLLYVDNLQANTASPSCTVGSYFIDWYLNSVSTPAATFTSGTAGSGALQQHPFTGVNARPVLGGTWIPVIRYVELNGIKHYSNLSDYYADPQPTKAYAPDLANQSCLNTISVENLTCTAPTNTQNFYNSDTGNAVLQVYSHKISYNPTTSNPADANRTLGFILTPTTKYIPYFFAPSVISDRLKVEYVKGDNSSSTTILDILVGGDTSLVSGPGNNGFNPNTTPVMYAYGNYKDVLELTSFTYSPNDYLRITVTANGVRTINPALTANNNTSWTLYLKCENTLDTTLTRPLLDPCRLSDVGGVVPFNSSSCVTRFNNIKYTTSSSAANYNTFVGKYLILERFRLVGIDQPVDVGFGAENCTMAFINNVPGFNSCANANGTVTITRNNNQVFIDCTSAVDYNSMRTQYNSIITWMDTSAPTYSGASTAQPAYYQFLSMFFIKQFGGNCGDATTQFNIAINSTQNYNQLTLHRSTPVNFNDSTNRITITFQPIPVDFSLGTCSNCQSTGQLASFRNQVNALANFTGGTILKAGTTETSYVTTNVLAGFIQGQKAQRSLELTRLLGTGGSINIQDAFIVYNDLRSAPFNSGTSPYRAYSVINKYFTSAVGLNSGWTRLYNNNIISLGTMNVQIEIPTSVSTGADVATNYRIYSNLSQTGSLLSTISYQPWLDYSNKILIYEVSGGVVTTNLWCATTTTTTTTPP